jgi:predicted 3-demethylubiquinone-9 3-methyltransferase (glyoxalase superfamily)
MLLFPDQSQLRCQFVATEEQGKISRAVRVATPRLRASDVDIHEPTNQRVRESVHLIIDIKSRKEIDDRTNKLRGETCGAGGGGGQGG